MWPYGCTTANLPVGHDEPGPRGAGHDRQGDGVPERLQAAAGERPVRRVGHDRDWLFGTYRLSAFTFEMSAVDYPKDTAIASETGPQQGRGPVPARAGLVPAGGRGRGRARGPLRRVRRRPGGRPRLDGEPGRDGHGTRVRPAGRAATRRGRACRASRSSRRRPRPAWPAFVTGRLAGDRRVRVRPRRAARRSARRRSSCRARPGSGCSSAGSSRTRRARPPRTTCARSSRDRTAAQTVGLGADRDRRSAVAGAWASASVSLDPWAGQAIRIRFEARGRGRRVDDRRGRRRRQGHAPARMRRCAPAGPPLVRALGELVRDLVLDQDLARDRARRAASPRRPAGRRGSCRPPPASRARRRSGARRPARPIRRSRRGRSWRSLMRVRPRWPCPSGPSCRRDRRTRRRSPRSTGRGHGPRHADSAVEQALEARRARDTGGEERFGDGAERVVVGRVADELDRPLARGGRSLARREQPGEPAGVSMLLHWARPPLRVRLPLDSDPIDGHARQRARRRPACSRLPDPRTAPSRRCSGNPCTRAPTGVVRWHAVGHHARLTRQTERGAADGTARRAQGADLRGRERPLDRLGDRQGLPRRRARPSASRRSRA